MKRTSARRLWVSSLVMAGAAASAAACSSADPKLPPDPNPVIVTDRAPPPISGGTLLATSGGLAVAADSDRDRVWVVDLGTQAVASIPLQKGDEPGRVVEDGAGRVHVALRGAGAIATLDLATRKVLARTPVCSAPRGLAYDASVDGIHVACSGGELVTLPAAGGAPIRSLRIADRDLRDVVVQGGQLFVTRFKSSEVLVLDAQGAVTQRQAPPALVNDFLGANFAPSVAWRALAHPAGGVVLLHQLAAETPVVITQPDGYGGGGDPTGCDTTIVHTTITAFGPGGEAPALPAPIVNGASVPVDLAMDSSILAIASAGSDSVFFVDSFTVGAGNPNGCVTGNQVKLPGQPVAVANSPAGFVAQIRDLGDGSPTGGTGAALVVFNESQIVKTIQLPADSVASTGHSLFHHDASETSPLACASCHPEGHEDGRVWVFDTLGSRRTQTVSGGVLATAPLHWNGDMHSLPDIMHEVFQHRMGGPEQGPRHVAAFGDWLNSIPAHPASPTGTAAQVEHGREIFNSADVGCSTCHSGAHFTNNATVSVGTGQPFQVPTLVGVAARRPFMHDGCAATLEDRFDPTKTACNGGEAHGRWAQLSAGDIADLIAYLETL